MAASDEWLGGSVPSHFGGDVTMWMYMAAFQWDYSLEVDTGWDYRHNVGIQGY